MKYDYLVVGAGLYGACFAHLMKQKGKTCLVIEKRNHIAGNIYCEEVNGITVHTYGAHIFHTSNKEAWDYVNSHTPFTPFTNSPLAKNNGSLYNLPFNMNTFRQLFGTNTPYEAKLIIDQERKPFKDLEPTNLEEQALKLVGRTIYEDLIKGYTEKQWGKSATELPAFIIKRIPLRFTYDNNYFNDTYQGIPETSYNDMIESMLDGIKVNLGVDYFSNKKYYDSLADKVVYTGPIDRYFDFKYGKLAYRSLKFETKEYPTSNYQGNAVINYTNAKTPYTRIIEHKHFKPYQETDSTIVTSEYPINYVDGVNLPYYPINDVENEHIANRYKEDAKLEKNVIFGGRMAEYKYYNMNDIIEKLLESYG